MVVAPVDILISRELSLMRSKAFCRWRRRFALLICFEGWSAGHVDTHRQKINIFSLPFWIIIYNRLLSLIYIWQRQSSSSPSFRHHGREMNWQWWIKGEHVSGFVKMCKRGGNLFIWRFWAGKEFSRHEHLKLWFYIIHILSSRKAQKLVFRTSYSVNIYLRSRET